MKKHIIIALFATAAFFPILFIPLIPLLGVALAISLFATLHFSTRGLWKKHHNEDTGHTGLTSAG